MSKFFWGALALVLLAGCEEHFNVIRTGNPDYERVWVGTLDAVSDHLMITHADKLKGVILARSDTEWARTEARIEIIPYKSQYDVKAIVREQKLKVFLRPSGLKTSDREDFIRPKPELEQAILRGVNDRVGQPELEPVPEWVHAPSRAPVEVEEPAPKPKKPKKAAKPAKKPGKKAPAKPTPKKPAQETPKESTKKPAKKSAAKPATKSAAKAAKKSATESPETKGAKK